MLDATELRRVALALLIASLLAVRGLRRGSLSRSGAAAAFCVGFLSFACATRFGLTLILFYVTGTRATRFRAKLKARIEDAHDGPNGSRTASQVLASSAPAVAAGVLHAAVWRYDAPLSAVLGMRSAVCLFYMLFFAACAGDTFSSELGIVLPGQGALPRLVTRPWVRVPRGTNGGVTWQGSVASAAGGAVIGVGYFALGPDYGSDQLVLVPLGVLGGVVGSLLDSVLGAVLQVSLLDPETGKVLKETPAPGTNVARRARHICGYDMLDGEAVNALSATLTASLAPALVSLCL